MRLRRSRISQAEALSLKSGPTQSGEYTPPVTPVQPQPVGGVMLPVDKLSVFLSNYWMLVILVLLLPLAVLFYKKREMALRLLTPILSRF
jgi:hypothetical protein